MNTHLWQELKCYIPNLEEFLLLPEFVVRQNFTSCGTHLVSDLSFDLGELKGLSEKCQVIKHLDFLHFILAAAQKLYDAKKKQIAKPRGVLSVQT